MQAPDFDLAQVLEDLERELPFLGDQALQGRDDLGVGQQLYVFHRLICNMGKTRPL